MKMTHHRVIRDGCIHLLILAVSQSVTQSVFYQVLIAVSDAVFKGNCLTEKYISFKNGRYCGLVVFINVNTCILTKGGNYKTFLKENYAVALYSC